MTIATMRSHRNRAVIDKHLQYLRERAERRRQLGIDAILRAEVDAEVAAADDTLERNPRTSHWS